VRLDRLTADHVCGALTAMREKGRARGAAGERAAQVAYDTLRAALNWAVKKDQLILAHPLGAVERPKVERKIDS
jgi:lambda repressor-like predicted transcriptional regulator